MKTGVLLDTKSNTVFSLSKQPQVTNINTIKRKREQKEEMERKKQVKILQEQTSLAKASKPVSVQTTGSTRKSKPKQTLEVVRDASKPVAVQKSGSTKQIVPKQILELEREVVPKCCGDQISKEAQAALKRGNGSTKKAQHGFGCTHYGVHDLYGMDGANKKFYLNKEGWLKRAECLDCLTNLEDLVQDKATKLFFKYCQEGLKADAINPNGSEEERMMLEDKKCNCVVCIPCWSLRVEQYDTEMRKNQQTGKRRSARNNK